MVSGVDQALYAIRGWICCLTTLLGILAPLFGEQNFLDQYVDVGIPQSKCTEILSAEVSPSWYSSFIVRGSGAQEAQVDSRFGLYSGIDFGRQNEN